MNLDETIKIARSIPINLEELKYLQNRIWWVIQYISNKAQGIKKEPINSIKVTFEIHTVEEIRLFRELVNSVEFGEPEK